MFKSAPCSLKYTVEQPFVRARDRRQFPVSASLVGHCRSSEFRFRIGNEARNYFQSALTRWLIAEDRLHWQPIVTALGVIKRSNMSTMPMSIMF